MDTFLLSIKSDKEPNSKLEEFLQAFAARKGGKAAVQLFYCATILRYSYTVDKHGLKELGNILASNTICLCMSLGITEEEVNTIIPFILDFERNHLDGQ